MSDPLASGFSDLSLDDSSFKMDLQLKKKKKNKAKETTEESTPVDAQSTPAQTAEKEEEKDYNYVELLERVFTLLREKNPNLSVRKKHIMPPPQLSRVGSRKTMWSNFKQICELMHRQPEHVQSFFLTETGTDGSIDANVRLLIKGSFKPKQVESLLKKYIGELTTKLAIYVFCFDSSIFFSLSLSLSLLLSFYLSIFFSLPPFFSFFLFLFISLSIYVLRSDVMICTNRTTNNHILSGSQSSISNIQYSTT
jgi:translation initiation factor 2 beta subunit (eIF-2beta)/eIF-5